MQSGLKRKSFKVGPCPKAVIDRLGSSLVTKQKASERVITGLASDALNRVVIASTSDGTVNVSIYASLHLFLVTTSNDNSFLTFTPLLWTT